MATTQKPDEKTAEAVKADDQKDEVPQKPDETVPGGRYEVNGKVVDANGNPVKE